MALTIHSFLLLIATLCFVLAALGVRWNQTIAVGLAALAIALL